MKVLLAGAFGNLGADILKNLIKNGHEVVAADIAERDLGIEKNYDFRKIDVTDPETLKGICDGCEAVITTVGLTKGSATVTPYEIDYQGNLNLLNEAKKAGVKHFTFISVIKADKAPHIPMLDAKAKFERELINSGLNYVIHRPTGYFYDIIKVFKPMILKGEVTLLGKKPIHANVISTEDFAEFIVLHMTDENATYNVGGKETYSYEELATLCFEAAGKQVVIKRAPALLFDVLAFVNKVKKTGKDGVLKFGKWTMTEEMVGDTVYGDMSFAEYIKESFKEEN
ncbi:MAG: SDR family oxidoreductase [Oscillospiraceae bacterium]|nr:SDR family oxidoreductase [Oscillospiraceae bacterium]